MVEDRKKNRSSSNENLLQHSSSWKDQNPEKILVDFEISWMVKSVYKKQNKCCDLYRYRKIAADFVWIDIAERNELAKRKQQRREIISDLWWKWQSTKVKSTTSFLNNKLEVRVYIYIYIYSYMYVSVCIYMCVCVWSCQRRIADGSDDRIPVMNKCNIVRDTRWKWCWVKYRLRYFKRDIGKNCLVFFFF